MNLRIVRGHRVPEADAHVVIDVIRAFTVAHVAFEQGAEEIWLCQTTDEAFALKKGHPSRLLMGEVEGLPPPGFDFGNSPFELSRQDLRGASLIHRTSHGTQAAVAANHSQVAAVTGFSNAPATAQWLRRLLRARPAASICLVASHPESDDDYACAQFIEASIRDGAPPSIESYARRILTSRSADAVRRNPGINPRDLEYCVRSLSPEYVMKVSYDQRPVVRKESLSSR